MKTLKIYFLLMLLIQTISISAQSVISGKIDVYKRQAYKSATDDELIMLEMSKREKKKFQKQKYSK